MLYRRKDQDHPQEKEMQKGKMVVLGGLKNIWEKKRTKRQRSKVLIAKFRLKLTKVGKTTRPCMYDLYQIPYAYTVEVTNRFKGLHLIDRVKNYG